MKARIVILQRRQMEMGFEGSTQMQCRVQAESEQERGEHWGDNIEFESTTSAESGVTPPAVPRWWLW
jgi:hypothetical protein